MLWVWLIVFIVALAALVKGADWLLASSEKIGLAIGLSPFIIGVVVVGIGTSLPELVSSIVAVYQGATEIVPANAMGSNIANMLLVIGFTAVVARTIKVKKDLINLDLPLLMIATSLFLFAAWDRTITVPESILLLIVYGIYLFYVLAQRQKGSLEVRGVVGSIKKPKVSNRDVLLLVLGLVGVAVGAKYTIDSVIEISTLLNIGTGVISLFAIALGTSLPELLVSVRAVKKGKPELALGNIFGSNIFNILVAVGIPGLFSTLALDEKSLLIGLPILFLSTLIFVISGISRRIHVWEGAMFLVLYLFFIGKLFDIL